MKIQRGPRLEYETFRSLFECLTDFANLPSAIADRNSQFSTQFISLSGMATLQGSHQVQNDGSKLYLKATGKRSTTFDTWRSKISLE